MMMLMMMMMMALLFIICSKLLEFVRMIERPYRLAVTLRGNPAKNACVSASLAVIVNSDATIRSLFVPKSPFWRRVNRIPNVSAIFAAWTLWT